MHATYTTLKNFTVTLGMCLVVLSFCANAAWAQSGTGDKTYERLARVKTTTSIDGVSEQPSQVALVSSYPNPFNPEATIRFDVRKSQQVRLSVFNELGQQVMVLVNGRLEAGQHEARLAAYGLPSGTYFVRLETDTGVVTRSVVLMK